LSWGLGWGYGPWGACIGGGPDLLAPTISLQTPAPSAVSVSATSNISFRLSDDLSGVDLGSIRIVITQGSIRQTAFENGLFIGPFKGPGSFVGANLTNGFDFIIDPVDPLYFGSTVVVEVTATDGQCNQASFSWSFRVVECVPEVCTPFSTLSGIVLGPWGSGFWGFGAWGGGGLTLIPVVGGGAPVFGSIEPTEGTTLGGTEFTILGANLVSLLFNDNFNDAILDNILWIPLGSGSVNETPFGPTGSVRCQTTNTPGSYAGLQARQLAPKSDFHIQLNFSIQTAFLTSTPPSEVVLATIDAALDPGNFLRISYVMTGPTATTGTIRCEVWRFGTRFHVFETPYSTSSGSLGLMRFYDPVNDDHHAVFWLNGNKLVDFFDCTPCTVQVRFFAYNGASPYQVETWFDNFISHSVVVFCTPFGCDIATNLVEVTDFKLRGKSPPTVGEWAGLTDVRVTNGSGNGCVAICSQCWTYQYPEAFVVGRSEPFRPTRREASFTNDPVLRNPNPNTGLGLRRQN